MKTIERGFAAKFLTKKAAVTGGLFRGPYMTRSDAALPEN
jgi:hypothetical protein